MLFSVITINYNHADGLERTIRSVVDQTYHDFEYIVIDGGSTDGSRDVIKRYADRIDFWVSEPDGGIYPAMNKGTAHAHGCYCLYLNSGDEFYSDDVLRQVAECRLDEDIVCGDLCIGGNILCNPADVTMKLFYKSTLYHQATFIRTTLVKAHPYDETMRSAADWKFLLHALVFHDATYRHLPVTIARFELGGFSEKNNRLAGNEVRSELRHSLPKRILDDYEDYCVGSSPFRFMMNKVEEIPPVKRIVFAIDRIVLKVLNIKLHAKWIKDL